MIRLVPARKSASRQLTVRLAAASSNEPLDSAQATAWLRRLIERATAARQAKAKEAV